MLRKFCYTLSVFSWYTVIDITLWLYSIHTVTKSQYLHEFEYSIKISGKIQLFKITDYCLLWLFLHTVSVKFVTFKFKFRFVHLWDWLCHGQWWSLSRTWLSGIPFSLFQRWARENLLALRRNKFQLHSKWEKRHKVLASKWCSHSRYRHNQQCFGLKTWSCCRCSVAACPALLFAFQKKQTKGIQ